MTDEKKEELKTPEKRMQAPEEGVHFDWDKESKIEKREISPDDKIVSDELRKEIEMMEMDDKTKDEAKKKAQKIEFLGEKEKIEHLLEIAREKGVVFAIQVAKKMNEPYLLDILHDILAREGFYQKMGKPTDDNDDNKV
jgi:hypothetical protein